jgi:hypothetical protein
MRAGYTWTVHDSGVQRENLPPDLTLINSVVCPGRHPVGYWCTRPEGHTGRHAAGNGTHILAVWPCNLCHEPECDCKDQLAYYSRLTPEEWRQEEEAVARYTQVASRWDDAAWK